MPATRHAGDLSKCCGAESERMGSPHPNSTKTRVPAKSNSN